MGRTVAEFAGHSGKRKCNAIVKKLLSFWMTKQSIEPSAMRSFRSQDSVWLHGPQKPP